MEGTGIGSLPVCEGRENSIWFREHFDTAAAEVIDFLTDSGIGLTGREVTDVGIGEGIVDLGIALTTAPARLVGFDIIETDSEPLRAVAQREGVAKELPPGLSVSLFRADPSAVGR